MANLFEPPRYIAVEGPIRVGKSTLCQVIAETLHAQRISEPETNPFLPAFYQGKAGAAFQAQFAFLIARYEQLGALDPKHNPNKTYVSDYIIIHELMHLRELNHSPRFWHEVEKACPEYRAAEEWLKQNSGQVGF